MIKSTKKSTPGVYSFNPAPCFSIRQSDPYTQLYWVFHLIATSALSLQTAAFSFNPAKFEVTRTVGGTLIFFYKKVGFGFEPQIFIYLRRFCYYIKSGNLSLTFL